MTSLGYVTVLKFLRFPSKKVYNPLFETTPWKVSSIPYSRRGPEAYFRTFLLMIFMMFDIGVEILNAVDDVFVYQFHPTKY
tara:strand:- start:3773 stop:4015 length:243 start_codon:yes stop_codon:yes gene_type:complete